MITKLHIDNYLLIDRLDMELGEGLNIITGETGAGKSILLGAISMLLGAKAGKDVARIEGRNAVIEGTFEIGNYNLQELFAEQDLEYDATTIIRRVILASGKSRAYINDLPVTLATLQSVGEAVMDIHSQHQSMLLSKEEFQTDILDSVAATRGDLERYFHHFHELKRLRLRLSKLKDDLSKAIDNQEYIKFQYDQLFEANLKSGELEELESAQKLLSNGAQIGDLLFATTQSLSQKEESVIGEIKSLASQFVKFSEILPSAAQTAERLTTVLYELKDVDREVSLELDRLTVDPVKLEAIQSQIDTIYTLMTKHKVKNVDELIEIREDLESQLKDIDLGSWHIEQCESQIEISLAKAQELAQIISEKRKKAAPEVEKYLIDQLSDLGMENSKLLIEVEEAKELGPRGADSITYLFSANKGHAPQPIGKVASGGEISRLMLSIKSLVALHKSLPTIIFDEIDTGVSGRVADKMGEIMERLGSKLQVICITHLPQVAAKGNNHFLVAKNHDTAQTTTTILPLSSEERQHHIATMLSGEQITSAALEQAKALLTL